MLVPSRRNLILGLTSLIAAPALVKVENLMKVKVIPFQPYMLVTLKEGYFREDGKSVQVKVYEKDDAYFFSEDYNNELSRLRDEHKMRIGQTDYHWQDAEGNIRIASGDVSNNFFIIDFNDNFKVKSQDMTKLEKGYDSIAIDFNGNFIDPKYPNLPCGNVFWWME